MILTAIVPGRDGQLFTLDSQREQLALSTAAQFPASVAE
jgi:hypothetical protein